MILFKEKWQKKSVDFSPHTQGFSCAYYYIITQKGVEKQWYATIEDIYGFEISKEMISNITDCVLDELNDWQSRPLKHCYPFIFVDCMYVNIKHSYEIQKCEIYTILGYDVDGKKDILGLWINDTESTHTDENL